MPSPPRKAKQASQSINSFVKSFLISSKKQKNQSIQNFFKKKSALPQIKNDRIDFKNSKLLKKNNFTSKKDFKARIPVYVRNRIKNDLHHSIGRSSVVVKNTFKSIKRETNTLCKKTRKLPSSKFQVSNIAIKRPMQQPISEIREHKKQKKCDQEEEKNYKNENDNENIDEKNSIELLNRYENSIVDFLKNIENKQKSTLDAQKKLFKYIFINKIRDLCSKN